MGCQVPTEIAEEIRSQGQSGEINAQAKQNISIHRCGVEYRKNDNVHGSGEVGQGQVSSSQDGFRGQGPSKDSDEVYGPHQFPSIWSEGCKEKGQVDSGRSDRSIQGCSGSVQACPPVQICKESVENMDKCSGISSGDSSPSTSGVGQYRCLQKPLGVSDPRWAGVYSDRPRPFSSGVQRLSHKSERTVVCRDRNGKKSGSDQEQGCQAPNRLTSGKKLPAKSGRYKEQGNVQNCMSNSQQSGQKWGHTNSSLHSDPSQPNCGRSVQKQASSRVVPESSCVSENQGQVSSPNRFDGECSNSSVGNLLHSNCLRQVGLWDRLFLSSLGLGNNVLFPTPRFDSNNSFQICQRGGQGQGQETVAFSPMLVNESLGSSAPKPALHAPSKVKVQGKSHSGCQYKQASKSFKYAKVASDPVAVSYNILRSKGYSESTSKLILESTKKGTSRTYKQNWKEWVGWCSRKNLDPLKLSVIKLCEFLNHLFEVGLAWSTIGCYRSAVCTILQPDVERTFASHKSVKRLMKSIFLKRPPKRKVFTPWRVHKLLKLLERMGPIDTLTLKELTWKTACLVSLATSKRMSDMSLMSVKRGSMYMSGDHIQFQLNFGSKTDRPNHYSNIVHIYRNKQNASLCPVLHLKKYVILTGQFRKTPEQLDSLWLSLNVKHSPVCASTIASWVRTLICKAKAKMSPGTLRAVTATRAICNNVNLGMIMQAGDWSKVSTPQNHYFRSYVPCNFTLDDAVQRAALNIEM